MVRKQRHGKNDPKGIYNPARVQSYSPYTTIKTFKFNELKMARGLLKDKQVELSITATRVA
jgi:hypothetical protein